MSPLVEIARLFLRLGTTAFGGPAAHIAMMEDEVVHRRGWLTHQQFLDYVAATNFIPGPNSTELAIHIGYARAGWRGLIVAGLSFILPAAAIVLALAWGYSRYRTLPDVGAFFQGLLPVVLVIVVLAVWRLGRSTIRTPVMALIVCGAVVALVAGVHELVVLAAAGLLSMLMQLNSTTWRTRAAGLALATVSGSAAIVSASPAVAAATPAAAWSIFLVFLKIGSVLFGSGYVLIGFLRAEVVTRLEWLTEEQLLDAIAIGQITPGPLFTTATFVGYLIAGAGGAAAATVGIFLPAFVFVALTAPVLPRLRQSRAMASALDGITAASLALMAVVTAQIAGAAIVDPVTGTIALVACAVALRWRSSLAWLMPIAGAVGWALLRDR